MANTTVSFTLDEGEILANLTWLPLAVGDTISFSDSSIPAVLFFSPDLIKILNPAPSSPLTLGKSAPTPFTVTAAQPGAYTIIVGSSPEFPPFFPDRSSTNLFFESMPEMAGGPAPVDPPPRTGS